MSVPSPRILFVDDESNILNSIERLMRQQPFEIVTTSSPFEALHLVSQEEFSVVVSDHNMPIMKGVEVLEKIREISPMTVRILLTAFADLDLAVEAINRGAVFKLLSKPWDKDELVEVMHQAVAHYQLAQASQPLQVQVSDLPPSSDVVMAAVGNKGLDAEDIPVNLKRQMSNKILEQMQEIYVLSQDLDNSQLNAVKALARMGKMQNKNISDHCERVSQLCKKLAVQVSYAEDPFQLEIAALLHDIGKVSMPKEILLKPEKMMNLNERALLQGHTMQGEALVGMIPLFKEAGKLICHHHEYFDGSGYPDGMKEKNIPMGSRIIAVADAYDNCLYGRLTSTTPLGAPATIIRAMESLYVGRLDPDIVKALKLCILGPEAETQIVSPAPTKAFGGGTPPTAQRPSAEKTTPKSPLDELASKPGWTEMLSPTELNASAQPTVSSNPASTESPPWWLEILVSATEEQNASRPVGPNQTYQAPAKPKAPSAPNLPKHIRPSGQEQTVTSRELSVGMVLSRDLISGRGGKLLPSGTIIKKEYIAALQHFLEKENLPIYIYQNKYLPEG